MLSFYWLGVIFVFCLIGILITAYFSIEAVKSISIKFKLSDSFIGAVFLAVGTSFPEFINSLVAGFSDRSKEQPLNAIYSFYNVTGANIWQIVFLIFIIGLICAWSKAKKKDLGVESIVPIFWSESFLSWKLIVLDTVVLLVLVIFPTFSSLFLFHGFNTLNLFFLVVWLMYIVKTYNSNRTESEEQESRYFKRFSKGWLFLITCFLWLLFGGFAYGNFYVSSLFPIQESASFGIVLSFITSTPEFSVLYFLFKKREYKLAVSGFFGSSLFNLVLPVFTNLISLNPILGVDLNVQSSSTGGSLTNLVLRNWLILNLILLFLFLFSFVKRKNPHWVMIANGFVVTSIYILANLFFVS